MTAIPARFFVDDRWLVRVIKKDAHHKPLAEAMQLV
jgi:hypothetical protein